MQLVRALVSTFALAGTAAGTDQVCSLVRSWLSSGRHDGVKGKERMIWGPNHPHIDHKVLKNGMNEENRQWALSSYHFGKAKQAGEQVIHTKLS